MTSPVAAAMLEDDLLDVVVKNALVEGWLVYHVRNSRAGVTQGTVGFPDLVLCRVPRLLFVELKRQHRIPTTDQMRWLDSLANSGAEIRVWKPSDWLDGTITRELARR